MNKFEFLSLKKAEGEKKYQVKLKNKSTGREKTVKFGAKGYTDYTISKDKAQKERYIKRHEKREDWTKSGVGTSGFWAKNLLWNKESISASLADIKSKYF